MTTRAAGRRVGAWTLSGVLALAVTATACSRGAAPVAKPEAEADTIVATLPAGAVSATAMPEPRLRIPNGASVGRATGAVVRNLTEGLVAAGAPCVRPDGKALLFVAKETNAAPYAVYECAADGSDRKALVRHAGDCQAAAYLPDGRIVYAGAIDGTSPVPGTANAQALFVAKGDGTAGARITFGAGFDADPVVLSDGRVLFSSWRNAPTGSGGALGLFTVHPDGTGFAAFRLDAQSLVLARQTADLDVRFARLPDGAEFVASWDAPMSSVAPAAATGKLPALPLVARPRAQGQLSVVKPEQRYATLYCVDARRGAPGATSVRVRAGGATPRVLGEVPLAADGSFHLRVPADTPIFFEAIDARGTALAAEHAPIWTRGNETRGCVGCHDDVETAPPNVRPAALRDAAVDLSAGGGVR